MLWRLGWFELFRRAVILLKLAMMAWLELPDFIWVMRLSIRRFIRCRQRAGLRGNGTFAVF